MNANELFAAGKLTESIAALTDHLRRTPLDIRNRTFLFELLCFAGEFDRAEKQLAVLGQGGKNAELGAMIYRAALNAERQRQMFFREKAYLPAASDKGSPTAALSGAFNGKPFTEISDADPRIGARLEVFVAGEYRWIPFAYVASIQVQPPKRLRDLLWTPALVANTAGLKGNLGDVLLPAISPLTSAHADEAVRLGRMTVWEEAEGVEVPLGQKMLLIDGEEVPLLELRHLEFTAAEKAVAT